MLVEAFSPKSADNQGHRQAVNVSWPAPTGCVREEREGHRLLSQSRRKILRWTKWSVKGVHGEALMVIYLKIEEIDLDARDSETNS